MRAMVLPEAVPDAILEIRYYSTYNFVGERIDGGVPSSLLPLPLSAIRRRVLQSLGSRTPS